MFKYTLWWGNREQGLGNSDIRPQNPKNGLFKKGEEEFHAKYLLIQSKALEVLQHYFCHKKRHPRKFNCLYYIVSTEAQIIAILYI